MFCCILRMRVVPEIRRGGVSDVFTKKRNVTRDSNKPYSSELFLKVGDSPFHCSSKTPLLNSSPAFQTLASEQCEETSLHWRLRWRCSGYENLLVSFMTERNINTPTNKSTGGFMETKDICQYPFKKYI